MTDTMRDVDHTHPHTNDTFGTVFTSGQAVAADGGEPSDERRTTSEHGSDGGTEADETETQTMADVDHAADEGVDRAYERGTEGRTDTV